MECYDREKPCSSLSLEIPSWYEAELDIRINPSLDINLLLSLKDMRASAPQVVATRISVESATTIFRVV